MKKQLTILLFILIILPLIGFGCNLKKDSYLAEKEKCFKYSEEINKSNRLVSYYGDEGEKGSFVQFVQEVFFSPKADSCLFVLFSSTETKQTPGENGIVYAYRLVDYFNSSNNIIIEEGCSGEIHCGQSINEAENNFKKKLKEYK